MARPPLDPLGTSLVAAHTQALAELGRQHRLTTPVPTCGDWSLADLIWHLTEVQDFWEHVISHRPAGPDTYTRPSRPADDQLVDLLVDRSGALVAALDQAEPDEPAWSWSDDHTVAFSLRRQAHEAIVHHIDGVLAVGDELPIVASPVAADGIDELVTVMLTGVPGWAEFERTGGSIRLITDDAGDTWDLGFGRMTGTSPDSGTTYDLTALELLTELDAPETTVSAGALDLELWMWGRLDADVLTVSGDPGGATRLRTVIAESTQ